MNYNPDLTAAGIKTAFIETTLATTNTILAFSGASKIIYFSECPYSQEFVTEKYKLPEDIRSVSPEFIRYISRSYRGENRHLIGKDVNSLFISTFQVGDNSSNPLTHGYIGIQFGIRLVIYHITIRKIMSRSEYVKLIGKIGVELLLTMTRPLITQKDLYVDIITEFDCYDNTELQVPNPITLDLFNYTSDDGFICFRDGDAAIIRAEDIIRDQGRLSNVKYFIGTVGSNIDNIIALCRRGFCCVLAKSPRGITNFMTIANHV